jgi:hypothetical protein
MNNFLSENRVAISLLSIWVFAHFVIFTTADDSAIRNENFYPFVGDLSLLETYDLPEFIAYGFFPVLVFLVASLFSKR